MTKSPPHMPGQAAGSAGVPQRIVAGARKHFLAHGFRAVTMDDLAAELGMSKKTLYRHFPSKTDLVEAVVSAKLGHVERELASIVGAMDRNLPFRLQALLACIRRHADEIQPSFVRDVSRETPDLFARVRKTRRELIHRHFGELLREGRAARLIRRDVPERLMIELLSGATDAIVNPHSLGELGLTPKAAFHGILTLFLDGAKTEKGRKKL